MTGIVIVNYKTAELTVDFVGRELSKLPSPWRLVIVDAAGPWSTAGSSVWPSLWCCG